MPFQPAAAWTEALPGVELPHRWLCRDLHRRHYEVVHSGLARGEEAARQQQEIARKRIKHCSTRVAAAQSRRSLADRDYRHAHTRH